MVRYAVLDVGMGGLVIVLGGVAVLVFAVIAAIIIRFSIRAIKKELKENCETQQLDIKSAKEGATEEEQTDEEV